LEVNWVTIINEAVKTSAAIATTLIAAVVAYFAYQQWRIAQQKVALDIFEKRLARFDAMTEALLPVLQSGSARPEDVNAFARAQKGAKFLFGAEVEERIGATFNSLNRLVSLEKQTQHSNAEKADAAEDQKAKHFDIVHQFFIDLDKLAMPYMKMHQKVSG
jgi:hypothetical protein